MHDISLKLDSRTASRKQVTKLRQEGLIPSVVYGGHDEVLNTQSPLVATTKAVHQAGKHSPIHLTIDGKNKLAMIKSIDTDPVRHTIRHVAFHAIKQNEIITAEVPIHLVGAGESPAERAGLVVLQAIEHIDIKAKPADLPEALELKLDALVTTDDKLTLADIPLPKGVVFADQEQNTTLVVANVYEPSALQAANEELAGEADASVEDITAENGGDTPQATQAEESKPGGKDQKEPKQSNVDANK